MNRDRTAPALSTSLNARLSVMMFLQYATWGAWLPLFWPYLTNHLKLTAEQAGNFLAISAAGALMAPFIAGQIADRWFNTERFLALSHILGGVLVWQLAWIRGYESLVLFGFLYGLIYGPTIPLTNALAFHHLPERDRDFPKVRVWGTIGWICVGIGIGQWLFRRYTPAGAAPEIIDAARYAGMSDAFRLSGILGVFLGLFCLTLPKTPPQRGRHAFAPLQAIRQLKNPTLLWLFLISFPISLVHQFYFVHTSEFLSKRVQVGAPFIDNIFGVGGGGLMTIGQMAEIFVIALMPFIARRFSRKAVLTAGLLAYIARFAVFAFLPYPAAVIPALALHGLVFGCFFFVAFIIIDEETTSDVRASAQGLYNFVVIGCGIIAGSWVAGKIAAIAKSDFRMLFGVPMAIAVVCLLLLLALYPRRRPVPAT